MAYKYICPTEKGYKSFTISNSKFIGIVPARKGSLRFAKVKGYVKDKHIILHYVPTVTGCILSTLLFPVGLLVEGFGNYKQTWDSMVVRMWYSEQKGSFIGDDVYQRNNGDTTFQELLEAAKFK